MILEGFPRQCFKCFKIGCPKVLLLSKGLKFNGFERFEVQWFRRVEFQWFRKVLNSKGFEGTNGNNK
mgnify:CR=1 FL=1